MLDNLEIFTFSCFLKNVNLLKISCFYNFLNLLKNIHRSFKKYVQDFSNSFHFLIVQVFLKKCYQLEKVKRNNFLSYSVGKNKIPLEN